MRAFVRLNVFFVLLISIPIDRDASSQDTKSPAGNATTSVQELRAVLQSINPYLPVAEVGSEIDVFGSTSMDSLAHGWAIGFQRFHPKAKIVISAEGSETVFDRMSKNPASIGMLSRPVTDQDLAELKRRGLKQPVAVMIAREALGVYVHESNPLESISYPELISLFCGDAKQGPVTWGQIGLGGKLAETPVVLLGRNSKSGTQTFVRGFVFAGQTMRAITTTTDSNAKLISALEDEPAGIAIAGAKVGAHGARLLPLRAGRTLIPNDDHSVLVGKYPLTRPLTLVFDLGQAADKTAANREFVHYALSHPGQVQAILSGFFPFDPPTLRAQNMKIDAEVSGGGVQPGQPKDAQARSKSNAGVSR